MPIARKVVSEAALERRNAMKAAGDARRSMLRD